MLIIKTIQEYRNQLVKTKKEHATIGFAPTMGALHEGHLSLIRRSKEVNSLSVCSIFVNPTQFNDPKDFEKYPQTIEADIALLVKEKCDILFLPDVKEMYPDGMGNTGKIDFGFSAKTLEGEFRPGHFDGMAQIVEKLLLAVMPDNLYMGQKDFQQAMIVSLLIKKRKLPIHLEVCPIKREKSGLAMSSRNTRLNANDLLIAAELYKTLKAVKSQIKKEQITSTAQAEAAAQKRLQKFNSIKLEYFSWRKVTTLKPIAATPLSEQSVLLIAAWIGGVRLIDNVLID